MSVSYDVILQKISDELQTAKKLRNNEEQLKRQIDHIRLLCDLVLAESEPIKTDESITAAELTTMLGKNEQAKQQTSPKTENITGDSIFDF